MVCRAALSCGSYARVYAKLSEANVQGKWTDMIVMCTIHAGGREKRLQNSGKTIQNAGENARACCSVHASPVKRSCKKNVVFVHARRTIPAAVSRNV